MSRTPARLLALLSLSALVGCDEPEAATVQEAAALSARIDALESTVTAQQVHIEEQETTIAGLQSEVDVLSGVDLSALLDAVAQNAADLATHNDALDQHGKDITALQAAADDAEQVLAVVSDRVGVIEGDYLMAADLTGYATEGWVSGQGFGTAADIAANTSAIAVISEDYLVAADLTGYATAGGVVAEGGSVSVARTLFDGNVAEEGAAIAAYGASVTLNEVALWSGVAREAGGMLVEGADLVIWDAWFHENEATDGPGGALVVRGDDGTPSLDVQWVTFSFNRATAGETSDRCDGGGLLVEELEGDSVDIDLAGIDFQDNIADCEGSCAASFEL